MANLTLSPPGRADGATIALSPVPMSRRPAAAVSVSNRSLHPTDTARRLWLDGVPQDELDALALALRKGPLDAHFFLTLESAFHRTALATSMAQGLVDDALDGLLPAGLPEQQRAAWRICLTTLLTLPRVDWEVHCVSLRSLLSEEVACRNSLLGAMRDALYRPLDEPRDVWNSTLGAQRERGVHDAREIAVRGRHPPAQHRDLAQHQLRQWLPELPSAQIERAVAQVAASAAATGDDIDARTALPQLFDMLDLEERPLVSDTQRVAALATLEKLAGGAPEPLLLTGGGNGDRLGQWLLSVAERADPAPPPSTSLRRALVDALLYVASLAPGWEPPLSPRVPGTRFAVLPATHVPTPMSSGAAQHGGRSVLAAAAGLVGSGLGLATLGWRWAFSGPSTEAPAPADAAKPAAEQIGRAVALLDDVIDRDGAGTIWHTLWHRVHETSQLEPAALRKDVMELIESNELTREVVEALKPAANRPEAEARHRPRRSLDAGERAQLESASQLLIDAAEQAPPPDREAPALPPGLDLALIRSRMLTWLDSMGRNASEQHHRLSNAWRQVVASEHQLIVAYAALPNLDRDLTQLLTADLRTATGREIDPTQIYLNTFQTSETWPTWEARQIRPPGVIFRNQHRLVPPDRRVRSGLVSAHTLVGAALLPVEAHNLRVGLYYRGTPETYFPIQECRELNVGQFARAIEGRDYLGAFRRRHDASLEQAWHGRHVPGSARYVTAIGRRLAGAAVLLNAAGQLSDPAAAAVKALVDFPTRFNIAEAGEGRALALPGWQIDVHALAANASGHVVPLHGVVLMTATAAAQPAVPVTLVISTTRTPLIQAFDSSEAAMQHLAAEVPHQLSLRVAVNQHPRWRDGALPVMPAYVIENDFRWSLFLQTLELRHAQLRATGLPSWAQLRHAFNALDAQLASPYLPIPVPVLAAAGELAALEGAGLSARSAAHWLARFPPDTPGALQNLGIEGARWLHALSVGRSLVERAYPLLVPFVQQRLDDEIMRRYRTAFDSSCCYVVSFKDGQASDQTYSGWVHNRAQKQAAASFAECAMTRAAGFDEAPGRLMGLYTSSDSALFDENNEVVGLETSQLLSMARELDVQGDYLRALDQFWASHEADVLATLRGGYLYGCAQQHADGSLSARGAQLALGVFGNMTAAQSQEPTYVPTPREGTRTGWLQIHGIASTVLHIGDAQGPEVLLYFPNDRHRFHEFASDADMMGWVERAAATDIGRRWLETSFDLADLQDGWISNGVHTALGNGAQAMFKHGSAVVPVNGEASQALVRRMRQRARRDAQTVMTSPWEAFRRTWMPRLERCQEAMGLVALVLPEVLPVVALLSAAELAGGLQETAYGDSPAQRREGAGTALGGALGLALSAPMGAARLAGLAARDGARLQPAIQAPSFERVADPLEHLAERYARPVALSGSRAADNGVHGYLGRQYIEQGDHAYEVAFDRAHGTWRLQNPAPGNFYHQPVRLNAEGAWEPHSDVGLRGGAPNSGSRKRQQWVDRSYRGSLNSLVERSLSRSVDSSSQDFAWGQENWGRVKPPQEADTISLQRMKELFVSGNLDPVQQGALSVIIERLDNTLRAERYIVVNEVVHDSVHIAGGQFIPASQSLLGEGMGMASSGMCTGVSRIGVAAMGQGEELHLLNQLRLAIREPGGAQAGVVRALIRDAQGVALQPGSVSASSLIAIDEIADFLAKVASSSQFILSGAQHSMALAVKVFANGHREYQLLDPNFGLMVFTKRSKLNTWLGSLFGSRYFSRLSGGATGSKADATLAEMYGAVPAPGSGRLQFHLRQVDTARMKDQAAARGWTALFEHVR